MARKKALARHLLSLALVCSFSTALCGCSLSLEPKSASRPAPTQSLLYSSDSGLSNLTRILKYSFGSKWQCAPRAIDASNDGGRISIDECDACIRSNGTHRAGHSASSTFYRVDGLDRDLLTISVFTPKATDDDPIRAAIDSFAVGTVSGAQELLPTALKDDAAIERVLRLYSRSTDSQGNAEIYSRYFLQLTQNGETRVLALSFLNAFSTPSDGWRLCLSPSECMAWVSSLSFNSVM